MACQASYWIARADVKGGSHSPSECLSSALDDVNACMTALDSIPTDDDLGLYTRKCRTLGIYIRCNQSFIEIHTIEFM